MILVIDVGTSSMRGILFDRSGTAVWTSQKTYELFTAAGGVTEMDLSQVDDGLTAILTEAGRWLRERGERVDAISVTAQRSSVIPVDREGRPLRAALMWQDTRAGSVCRMVEGKRQRIYEICGMNPSPVFSAPKMRYLKDTEAEIYDKACKLIGFQEYVICFLTGEFKTDDSIASRTCLFDIKNLCWSEELLEIFGLDREKLCDRIPAGAKAGDTKGTVTALLAQKEGIPVISAGGDQQCAALGLGCMDQGEIVANSGTGSFVMAMSDRPVFDRQRRVNCNLSAVPGKWMIEASVLSAGKAISWLNGLMFPEPAAGRDPFEAFARECRTSPPGAKGLLFLPLLAGKGTPLWDSDLRGAVTGMSLEHGRGDFARALLEGIALELRQCIQVIQELSVEPCREIRAAGGITKNPLYNQIQADAYQMRLVRPDQNEATGLGAWISGAVWLGWYGSHREAYRAAAAKIGMEVFDPEPERAALYDELYRKMRLCEAAVGK